MIAFRRSRAPQLPLTPEKLTQKIFDRVEKDPNLATASRSELKGALVAGSIIGHTPSYPIPALPSESVALRIIGKFVEEGTAGKQHENIDSGLLFQSHYEIRSDKQLKRAIRQATGLSDQELESVVQDVLPIVPPLSKRDRADDWFSR
jgi:hypothetical protein